MLLSDGDHLVDSPAIRLAARPPDTHNVTVPLWTDDFAGLFQILRSEKPLKVDPKFVEAQIRTAMNFSQAGDFRGAAAVYRLALEKHGEMPDLLNNLAWLLATNPDPSARNGQEAVQLAETACRLTQYQPPMLIGTLAAAYAEAGRFEDAIWAAEKACAMAAEQGNDPLQKRNRGTAGVLPPGKGVP